MKKNFVKKLGITACSMALLLTPTSVFANIVNTNIDTNTKIETYASDRYSGYTRGCIDLRASASDSAPRTHTTAENEFYTAIEYKLGWVYIKTAYGYYGWAKMSDLCPL